MLAELTIDEFAIIDHLQIRFNPGFNVLTGETGAGKSIIVDAVAALLGSKLDRDQIRAGADQTSIEAIFELHGPTATHLETILSDYGLLDEGDESATSSMTVILRRDLRHSGRSVCRVNGRAVPLRVMEEIGQYLVDIHGQGEHLLLLRPREQIGFLDRYAGLVEERGQLAAQVRQLQRVREELEHLRRDERELARRIDLLQYEVGEITSAKLKPGEEEELTIERDRLANAEKLAAWAEAACALLYEGEGEGGTPAVDLLGQALHLVTDLCRVDPSLGSQRQVIEETTYQIEDVARTLRSYRQEIEFNPRRLEQVEGRLALIHSLRRKYGDSIDAILDYARQAQAELSQIEHAEERIEALQEEEDRLLREIGRLGEALSAVRREAGERLAREVERELSELRMERTRFAVRLERVEAADGAWVGDKRYRFDSSGIDRLEFLISANPGEPLRPLASVASGGETSRLMLALKHVLTAADEVPTLVFDEIDAGIGGVVGSLVGQKLRRLARDHQVLCVTHLPQLAATGSLQLKVEKDVQDGRTATRVRPLSGEERVREIALMMGAVSEATVQSAREMLEPPAAS